MTLPTRQALILNSTNLHGGLRFVHGESWWCMATPPGSAGCAHSQCGPGGQPGPAGFSLPRPAGPPRCLPAAAAPPGPERDHGMPAENPPTFKLHCWVDLLKATVMQRRVCKSLSVFEKINIFRFINGVLLNNKLIHLLTGSNDEIAKCSSKLMIICIILFA